MAIMPVTMMILTATCGNVISEIVKHALTKTEYFSVPCPRRPLSVNPKHHGIIAYEMIPTGFSTYRVTNGLTTKNKPAMARPKDGPGACDIIVQRYCMPKYARRRIARTRKSSTATELPVIENIPE